jgi:hypothetical protein
LDGDILLIGYTGELGTGHEYSNAPATMIGTVQTFLKAFILRRMDINF